MTSPLKRSPSEGRMDVVPPDQPTSRMHLSMLRTVGPAMLVLVLSIVATYGVPGLEFARPWTPDDPVPFWNVLGRPFRDESTAQTQAQIAKIDALTRELLADDNEPTIEAKPHSVIEAVEPGAGIPPYHAHPDDTKPVVQSVEQPTGHELDRFFRALARSDASISGAMTRVVHWGDSAIGIDGIPSAIRKRLQARFGDGGHGFHLIAPPNTSYRHKGILFSHNDRWNLCFIIHKCRNDGYYGLGGATVRSSGGGRSRFAPDPDHSAGRVSHFDLYYAAQPRGGRIELRIDDEPPIEVETNAEQLEDRVYSIVVDDGPHSLTVRAAGGGSVRLFGVVMEREGPGIVWDGLALVGAFTRRMVEFDPDHLRAQLQQRQPDLAVLMFGGNDMIRKISMERYEEEYREVIAHIRSARPEMDCLVMSPLDHAERHGIRIVSRSVVPSMVTAQRQAAEHEGCAFFDTWSAMGGDGSAGRWFRQSPRLIGGDLSHLTFKGQAVVGEMLYRALMEAYVAYRKREG